MSLFITIEGADAVGKTTIAQKLAEEIGATYFKTPSKPFNNLEVREEVDRTSSPLTAYFYYRASVQHASDQIKKLLEEGKTVVCDRYIKSTQIYREIINPEIVEIFEETDLIKPDFEFLLTASAKVREERLNMRDDQYGEDNERDVDFQNKIQRKYLDKDMIEIDTDNLSIEEVIEVLKSNIEE